MLASTILDFLDRAISISQGGAEYVLLRPNEVRDVGDAPLLFAVDAREQRTRYATETTAITTCVGVIVVSARADVGLGAVDEACRALVELLAPVACRALVAPGFPARVYSHGARREPCAVANGRYCATLLIDLELEEELYYGG